MYSGCQVFGSPRKFPRSRKDPIQSFPSCHKPPCEPPPSPPGAPSGICRWLVSLEFMSTWNTPSGAAFAIIQTYPPPTAIPLVLRDGVVTVFRSLPFQSTSQADSSSDFGSGSLYAFACSPVSFCSPIHRPSGVTDTALGNPCGLLNSLVVLAFRTGIFLPPCAKALRPQLRARPAPIPAVRNSRFVIKISMTDSRSDPQYCVQISLSQTTSSRLPKELLNRWCVT